MTKAVVFDLDGTLIDSLPDVTNAANALLADVGLSPLQEHQVAGFVGLGERVFLDRLIAATALDPTQYNKLMVRFIEHYKASTGATRVFPGVLEALNALQTDGFVLGICTNKPAAPLDAVLKALDLKRWFGEIVAGDDLPKRKPNPAPLHLVLERFGATEAVYVGDSDVDAETARNAKLPFAFFTEGICTKPISEIPHDRAFSDFADLPDICRDLIRPI